jgi:hypothetical protein
MKAGSPKHNFLYTGEEQDFFDNLIQVDRTAYSPGKMAQAVHESMERTKLMRGGLGSGKTRCASEHGNAINLTYPGARGIIARKNLGDLKDTTQKEFLEKVVAPETIAGFNVNDNDLHFKNGSIVHFRETKDPAKFKSYEISWYLIDEADENDSEDIWDVLDGRLRQKIMVDGKVIYPPYAGLLVFNPPDDTHWLYHLAQRTDLDLRDFQFNTFDNAHNLPPDYIPNLLKKLPPWDIDRLVYGNWGTAIKGKPVIHGFTHANNVRPIRFRPDLPLIRGWDFGFNHPCVSFLQVDPDCGRVTKLKEILGHQIYLPEFTKQVKQLTSAICGPSHPVEDYGDPHGNDQKDTGPPAIEYLRVHHGIFVQSRRAKIKGGLDEIQELVLRRAPYDDGTGRPKSEWKEESCFLVHPDCKMTITAYMGGYYRDEHGDPVKDGKYDHVVDTDRYPVEYKKFLMLAKRQQGIRRGYQPKNRITGY